MLAARRRRFLLLLPPLKRDNLSDLQSFSLPMSVSSTYLCLSFSSYTVRNFESLKWNFDNTSGHHSRLTQFTVKQLFKTINSDFGQTDPTIGRGPGCDDEVLDLPQIFALGWLWCPTLSVSTNDRVFVLWRKISKGCPAENGWSGCKFLSNNVNISLGNPNSKTSTFTPNCYWLVYTGAEGTVSNSKPEDSSVTINTFNSIKNKTKNSCTSLSKFSLCSHLQVCVLKWYVNCWATVSNHCPHSSNWCMKVYLRIYVHCIAFSHCRFICRVTL